MKILLLDRVAAVFAVLTSTNYCGLPLVQGELETPYRIERHMPPTMKNKKLIWIYKSRVDTLCYQREEPNIAVLLNQRKSLLAANKEIEENVTKNSNEERKTRRYKRYIKVGNKLSTSKTQKSDSSKNDVVQLSDWTYKVCRILVCGIHCLKMRLFHLSAFPFSTQDFDSQTIA